MSLTRRGLLKGFLGALALPLIPKPSPGMRVGEIKIISAGSGYTSLPTVTVGYKGRQGIDSGYFYAPYVPRFRRT